MKRSPAVGLGLWLCAAIAWPAVPAATSCITCHSDAELFDEASLAIIQRFADDVHAASGLSCHDCHGGSPAPALSDDPDAAMDPAFVSNPYRGVPLRQEVPAFCGRCHSDPLYMKRFRPDARVDQEEEYATSQHGQALARGDPDAATCVDCHGVHGILPAGDPSSPVYPSGVAETCGRCHADPQKMAGHTLGDGRPIPIDQTARWARSVHAQALIEKGDISAPTCNDCHGNHGATPPGLESVAFVCGQCHGREAELYRSSPKQEGFRGHNEYLASVGGAGCAACHADPEPQGRVTGLAVFGECTSCHGNHSIVRPTVAMLSPLPPTPCSFCHESEPTAERSIEEPERVQRRYREARDELLAEASAQGLAGEAMFDWLVDRTLRLAPHSLAGPGEGQSGGELKPEFAELFGKLRIGKTTFTYVDPATGHEVQERVRRCNDCHGAEPALGEPQGHETARIFTERIAALAERTARAQRMLLRARRGGVATRQALQELEQAIDAQIELEVLVHGFSADEDSAFVEESASGLEHAGAALSASERALEELAFRRRGLALSLISIVLLLVGLALKIRQLP